MANTVTIDQNLTYSTSLNAPVPLDSSRTKISGTPSGDPKLLIYKVKGPPQYGVIKKSSQILGANDTFTQKDINDGLISYVPDASQASPSPTDNLPVETYETNAAGQKITPISLAFPGGIKFNITIPPAPPTGTFSGITLVANTDKVLSTANFNYDDVNNPGEYSAIQFEVQSLPTKGTLQKKVSGTWTDILNSGAIFTQEDINNGSIRYLNKNATLGASATSDSFTFKPKDPQDQYGPVKTFPITITLVFEKPVVTIIPLELEQGATKQVNIAPVKNVDIQDADTQPPDLKIKVVKLPLYGRMKLSGADMTAGQTITFKDILDGKVTYAHDPVDTHTADEWEFSVSDGTPTNDIPSAKLPIKIKVPENLPPVVTINPVEVASPGGSKPVTKSNIKIEDPENLPADKIKVCITRLPAVGDLLIGGAKVVAADLPNCALTYADIVAGTKLVYKHNGTNTLTDDFEVQPNDGKERAKYKVPVIITARVNLPPKVDKNEALQLDRNQPPLAGDITASLLAFSDPDSPNDKVEITITKLPQFGKLKVAGVEVTLNQKATRTQWLAAVARYELDATSTTATQDSFEFKLNDEDTSVGPYPFLIKIKDLVPTKKPTVVNTGLTLYMFETKMITPEKLGATDQDTGDADLTFTITQLTVNGDLLKDGVAIPVNSTFTVADIKNNKISYKEKVANVTTDTFKFNLCDNTNNCVNDATFTITILPGLKVVNKGPGSATPGAGMPIPNSLLQSTSPRVGTDLTKLIYKIKVLPTQGNLQKGGANATLTTTFTQQDINDGKLSYLISSTATEDNDSFGFEVTDGTETIEETFPITFVLNDPKPVVTNTGLTIPELQCSPINAAMMNATDQDALIRTTAPDKLVFKLVNATLGDFKKDGVRLGPNDTWTAKDIQDGKLQYCTGDAATSVTNDKIDFTVDDGHNTPNGTYYTFQITIKDVPPPSIVSVGMTADACFETGITPTVLRIDNPPLGMDISKLTFRITSLPDRGQIRLRGNALAMGESFSQADVAAGNVTYLDQRSDQGVTGFEFDWVYDGVTGGHRDFPIRLRYTNNPPWVCRLEGLEMNECEVKILSSTNIQACDVDLDINGAPNIAPPLTQLALINQRMASSGDVFSVQPGKTYNWQVKVYKGSARFAVAKVDGTAIGGSGSCRTDSHSGTFTVPANTTEIKLGMSVDCVVGARDTLYDLIITPA